MSCLFCCQLKVGTSGAVSFWVLLKKRAPPWTRGGGRFKSMSWKHFRWNALKQHEPQKSIFQKSIHSRKVCWICKCSVARYVNFHMSTRASSISAFSFSSSSSSSSSLLLLRGVGGVSISWRRHPTIAPEDGNRPHKHRRPHGQVALRHIADPCQGGENLITPYKSMNQWMCFSLSLKVFEYLCPSPQYTELCDILWKVDAWAKPLSDSFSATACRILVYQSEVGTQG